MATSAQLKPDPDAEPILRAVKAAGLLVAIVSVIHYMASAAVSVSGA